MNDKENPRLSALKEWVDEQMRKSRGRSGLWLESLTRCIDLLLYGNTGKAFNSNEPLDIEKLINKNVIFELDNIGNELRAFFTSYIMMRVYINAKSKPHDKLKQVMIFDEGHRVFKKQAEVDIGSRIAETMCRELRSFGHGLIISTQHPSKLSLEAFGNTNVKICFNLNIKEEIYAASGSLLLNKEKIDYINKLKIGQAIVKMNSRFTEPFLIQTRNFSENIGSASDKLIRDFMEYKELIPEQNDIDSKEINDKGGIPGSSTDQKLIQEPAKYNQANIRLNENQLLLIKELIKNSLSTTTELHKNLGFCSAKGTKIKTELIKNEIIKPVKIEQKHGQLILLELTQKGRELLKSTYNIKIPINHRIGGLEHQYWQ